MTTRPLFALLPFAMIAACSSSSGNPASAGGGGGSDSGTSPTSDAGSDDDGSTTLLAPPPAGQGIQLSMTATIPASSEDEQCRFVQTTEDMWVNHEDVRYTPGSHHFLVWNTTYTSIPTMNTQGMTVDTTKVFDCSNGPQAGWNTSQMVGGAQGADAPPGLSDLPANVALHIPAGSVLMLDLHVLNTTTSPLTPTAVINFDTIPQSQVTEEAGLFFFYNPFIVVPPNAMAEARMSCPVTSNVTLTTAQTHMHKQGLGGVANLLDSTGAMLQQLYTSSVWTDPPVTQWSPGMALTAGQQIDYHCNYENTGTTTVIQGGSAATNEMCVFTGAYYPRDTKFETCSTTGNINDSSNAATYIGSGTTTCQDSMTCLSAANTDEAFFSCMVDSCPGAAVALTAALNCFEANTSNPASACTTQEAACVAASCN
jgi:hypothetical protein